MILFIVIGASAFGFLITMLRAPQDLMMLVESMRLSATVITFVTLLLYFLLGMFLEPVSIITITIPIIYPIISESGINGIWYCILLVKLLEIANLTPPIGMNVFVIKGLDPTLSSSDAFSSVVPYILTDFVTLALLATFPVISLWLPTLM